MNFSNYMKGANVLQLYRPIGGSGINCAEMAAGILSLENQGQKTLEVRVNTVGGNIVEGYSIYSAIRNSGMDIKVYNDFLAASAGGWICMSVPIQNRYMASNALFMLHNVSSPNKDPKSIEVGEKMKDSIVESFVKATGQDASVISDLMDNETWLNADEAVAMGFFLRENIFDAVVSDPKLNKNNAAKNAIEVYEFSNSLFNQKDTMEKELKELQEKLASAEAKNSALENEKKALEASVANKDKALEVAVEKEAIMLVDNAIAEGKLTKESKDSNVKIAVKDLDGFKNILSAIPTQSRAASFSNYAGSGEGSLSKEDKERENWTHRDWEKKDPKGLVERKKQNPDWGNALYDNEYKQK